jgi:hypothetical protein
VVVRSIAIAHGLQVENHLSVHSVTFMGFKMRRLAMHIGGELHITHKKAHSPSGCFTKDAVAGTTSISQSGKFYIKGGCRMAFPPRDNDLGCFSRSGIIE